MKPVTNRESVDCVVVADHDAACAHGAGAVYFVRNEAGQGTHVGVVLPCDTDPVAPREIPVDGSRGWRWDGNLEKPSMEPSILASITWGPDRQYIELWHGFMRNGRLVSC